MEYISYGSFPENEKKNLLFVLWSFFEVTDWVGRLTQNVYLPKDKDVSLPKESK